MTGLELWRWQESQTINTPIDVLVPPQSQRQVKQQLDQANISFVVKVADLQEDINDENPNVNASSYNTKAGIINIGISFLLCSCYYIFQQIVGKQLTEWIG